MTPEQLERLRRAASGPMVANTQINSQQMPMALSGILSQPSAPTTTNTPPPPGRKTLGERATGLLSQIGKAIYGDDQMTRLRRQNAFQAMTLNPNQALIASNAAQIKSLQEQELATANAADIAEYLRGLGKHAEAALVLRNPQLASTILGPEFRASNTYAPVRDPKTEKYYVTRVKPNGEVELIETKLVGQTAEEEADAAAYEASQTALFGGYQRAAVDIYTNLQSAAQQASAFMPKLQKLKEMSQQVKTGFYAPAFMTAKQIFGVDVSDMEVLNAELMGLAQDILNQQTGTKTDFDFQVAVAQSASLGKTPEANAMLIDAMIERQEQAIRFAQQADEAMESGDLKNVLKLRYAPPEQAPNMQAPSQQEEAVEGQVVRNPNTGEELILRNGQWVPFTGVD